MADSSRPIFIWEPVPDRCTVDEKQNMFHALKVVDVLSPNYVELAGFYGGGPASRGGVDKEFLESTCDDILLDGVGAQRQGAAVVRVGSEGCYVATHGSKKWYPAYHKPPTYPLGNANPKVVDPTGGGNAFLGGLAVGLVRTGGEPSFDNIETAVAFASTAASFAIEQVGMPTLSQDADGSELWNGSSVAERLSSYIEGLASVERDGQMRSP